jgi:hypothetical protein
VRGVFRCGADATAAVARGTGAGEAFDGAARFSSVPDAGVLRGLGSSSSFRADLDFALLLLLRDVPLLPDFFSVAFGLGVAVWRRLDFGGALRSGVSRGVEAVFPTSLDFSFVGFASPVSPGDFFGVAAARWVFADFRVALFAFETGLGDFFGFGDDAGRVSIASV